MSTEWSAERLDALPEGAVIKMKYEDFDFLLILSDGAWFFTDGDVWESTTVAELCESIRVVSVPIDALLADETVQVAEDAFVNVTHLAGPIRDEAETVIRAAVAHVTGETP